MFGLGGLGGGGKVDPRKMQAMMKQLGMSQEEISASRVIIEKPDSGNIVINNPSVVKMTIQGQEMFQVSGDISEETGISEEDIKTIMEKADVSEEQAKKALEESGGDLAEAILKLGSSK